MGIKEEVLSEKMKHCENPINFFSYYYLDKTEDRLTEKDLEYDFGLMIDKTIEKSVSEVEKIIESWYKKKNGSLNGFQHSWGETLEEIKKLKPSQTTGSEKKEKKHG